jgi:3-isopropylmalate/(R)-2-methylmalate dehydratase small subunit
MLAACAVRVENSRGRRYPEPAHPYRDDFQRDRDRVIHSRAFRRLENKTQVFTRRYSDHFRNRLTHTIEVAQVARTVAGALGLNVDLVECLALVHDIGHPPFGHAGEKALDTRMREHGDRFDHNLHALRIVEHFEQRYLDNGKDRPDFVLNKPAYRKAQILVAGANFGCGSSREHAPWALLDFGIRCVIAPSFADIFYNNCFKNGILPIALPQAEVDKLMDDAERGANAVISVDLEKQEIRGPDGGCIKFDIDRFRKQCLLNGWDDIGLTLRHEKDISEFEARRKQTQPWV